MSDSDKGLRCDSSNSLEFNKGNSIIVDEDLLHRIMQLDKQHDLEKELKRLEELNNQEYRKQRTHLEDDYDREISDINTRRSRVSTPSFYSSVSVSKYGGQKHRCLGLAYTIAAQSRTMSARYGSSYRPNFVAQQCMRSFPRARM